MKTIIVSFGLTIGLVSCGRGDGVTPVVDPAFLEGTWLLPCQEFNGTSLNVALIFGGSAMERTITSFSGSSCTNETHKLTISYGLEIPRTSDVSHDSYEVDLTSASADAVALDEDAVDLFNDKTLCGFSDWEEGKTLDISKGPAGCFEGDLPPEMGITTYTIFKVHNDWLLNIGQNSSFNDGKTSEKRHVSFDPLSYQKWGGSLALR